MASTAVSVDAKAVTTRTTVLGECSFVARRTAMPSTFRILKSVMTRSNGSLLIASTACSPPSATVTSWPACLSMMARSSRMLRSSSTTSTRVSGMAWQGKGERRAQARRAAHVDVTAVLLHDAVDQREPESGSLRFGGEEGLEDVREVARGDALAGIAHGDLERVPTNRRGDPELAALGHRLDGVQAEIPQNLPELLGVDGPEHGRGELANDLEAARAGAMLQQQHHLLGGGRHVERRDRERCRTRVLEEILDDVIEPLGFARHDLRQALARVLGRLGTGEDLDGAGEGGQRVADLVRDVRRHASECRQPVGLPHPRLHRADRREVLAGADQAEPLAFTRPQRGEGHPDRYRRAAGPPQRG